VAHPFAVLPRSGVPNEGSCSLGWDRVGYSRRQARPASYFLTTLDEKQANSTRPLVDIIESATVSCTSNQHRSDEKSG
jgi:hypothetical protein